MIQFMDLKRQYNNYKEEFLEAIAEVCDDTAFSGGKYSEKFEKEFAEYVGANYCSSVNSGTSALHLAVKALGIGEGDEVIIPADTFIASAWGALYEKATPVFVDCDADNWEIDVNKIEAAITPKTKAIVGVHLYGHPFDVDSVISIAKNHNLYVIEDCAQAHGTLYKGRKVGALGDVGCFSFYPGKNLGAFGEGGAITTNSKEIYEKIELYKNHGSSVRYYHDVEGYNMRLDGIQGAVLSVKLKYLDQWNSRRKEIASKYQSSILNDLIKMQKVEDYAEPVYHLFEIEVDDAGRFMDYMSSNGVTCARHYPVPCHLQKVFSDLRYEEGDLPVAEYHAKHCVTLPMYPELRDDEVDCVIKLCNSYR